MVGWRNVWSRVQGLGISLLSTTSKGSPLSITDALIYLADIFDPGRSVACLAARFSVSWATVRRSRQKLSNLTYSPNWFADIIYKQKATQDKALQEFLRAYSGGEKLLVVKMLKSNPAWSQAEVERFLKIARNCHPTRDGFDNLMYLLKR